MQRIATFPGPPKGRKQKIATFPEPPTGRKQKIVTFSQPPKGRKQKIATFPGPPKGRKQKIATFSQPPTDRIRRAGGLPGGGKRSEKKKNGQKQNSVSIFYRFEVEKHNFRILFFSKFG